MLEFILLGIVQGLTEFFPVSSSAHLVILQHILGINNNVVFIDVVLHLGTLFSLLVFFGKHIFILIYNFFMAIFDIIIRGRFYYVWRYNDKFRLCIHILVVTLITGVIAIIGKDFFEKQFESINTVILSLFVISFVLFLTKNFIYNQRDLKHISFKDSVLLGLAQAIAIIPGISRSGITISTLLFRNMDMESAFKFSFIASMPAITGAFILKLKETQGTVMDIPLLHLISGFLFAFFTGLAALYMINFILKRRSFYKFSYYCFFLSILVLLLKIFHIIN